MELYSPIKQTKEIDEEEGEKYLNQATKINISDLHNIDILDLSENEKYLVVYAEQQIRFYNAEQLFKKQALVLIDQLQLQSKFIQDIQWKVQNEHDMVLIEDSDSIYLIELTLKKIENCYKINTEYGACFGINNTYLLAIDKKRNLNFYVDEFKTIQKSVNLLKVIDLLCEQFEVDEESNEIIFYSTRQITDSMVIIFGAFVVEEYVENFYVTVTFDETKEIINCVAETMDDADAQTETPSLFTFMKFSKTREFGLICHNKQDFLKILCNDFNCKIMLQSNSMKLKVSEHGDDTLIRGVAYQPAGDLSIERQEGYEFKLQNLAIDIIWYPPSLWIFSSDGKLYRYFLVDQKDLKEQGMESKYTENKQKFKEIDLQLQGQNPLFQNQEKLVAEDQKFKANFIQFLNQNEKNQQNQNKIQQSNLFNLNQNVDYKNQESKKQEESKEQIKLQNESKFMTIAQPQNMFNLSSDQNKKEEKFEIKQKQTNIFSSVSQFQKDEEVKIQQNVQIEQKNTLNSGLFGAFNNQMLNLFSNQNNKDQSQSVTQQKSNEINLAPKNATNLFSQNQKEEVKEQKSKEINLTPKIATNLFSQNQKEEVKEQKSNEINLAPKIATNLFSQNQKEEVKEQKSKEINLTPKIATNLFSQNQKEEVKEQKSKEINLTPKIATNLFSQNQKEEVKSNEINLTPKIATNLFSQNQKEEVKLSLNHIKNFKQEQQNIIEPEKQNQIQQENLQNEKNSIQQEKQENKNNIKKQEAPNNIKDSSEKLQNIIIPEKKHQSLSENQQNPKKGIQPEAPNNIKDSQQKLQTIIVPEKKNQLQLENSKNSIQKIIKKLKTKYDQCQRIREENSQLKLNENPLLDQFSDFNLETVINYSLSELEQNELDINNYQAFLSQQQKELIIISDDIQNVQIHYQNLLSIWNKLKEFYNNRTLDLSLQQLEENENKLWPSQEEFPDFKFEISHTFEQIETLLQEFQRNYQFISIILNSQKAVRQQFPKLSPQRNLNQLEANFLSQQKLQQSVQNNNPPIKKQKKLQFFNTKNYLTQKFEPLVPNKTEKYLKDCGAGSVVIMQNYLNEHNKQHKQQLPEQEQQQKQYQQDQLNGNMNLQTQNLQMSLSPTTSSALMNKQNQIIELIYNKTEEVAKAIASQYNELIKINKKENQNKNEENQKHKQKVEKQKKQKKTKPYQLQIGSYKFDIDELMQDTDEDSSEKSNKKSSQSVQPFNYLLPEKQQQIFEVIKELCAKNSVKVKQCSQICSGYTIKKKDIEIKEEQKIEKQKMQIPISLQHLKDSQEGKKPKEPSGFTSKKEFKDEEQLKDKKLTGFINLMGDEKKKNDKDKANIFEQSKQQDGLFGKEPQKQADPPLAQVAQNQKEQNKEQLKVEQSNNSQVQQVSQANILFQKQISDVKVQKQSDQCQQLFQVNQKQSEQLSLQSNLFQNKEKKSGQSELKTGDKKEDSKVSLLQQQPVQIKAEQNLFAPGKKEEEKKEVQKVQNVLATTIVAQQIFKKEEKFNEQKGLFFNQQSGGLFSQNQQKEEQKKGEQANLFNLNQQKEDDKTDEEKALLASSQSGLFQFIQQKEEQKKDDKQDKLKNLQVDPQESLNKNKKADLLNDQDVYQSEVEPAPPRPADPGDNVGNANQKKDTGLFANLNLNEKKNQIKPLFSNPQQQGQQLQQFPKNQIQQNLFAQQPQNIAQQQQQQPQNFFAQLPQQINQNPQVQQQFQNLFTQQQPQNQGINFQQKATNQIQHLLEQKQASGENMPQTNMFAFQNQNTQQLNNFQISANNFEASNQKVVFGQAQFGIQQAHQQQQQQLIPSIQKMQNAFTSNQQMVSFQQVSQQKSDWVTENQMPNIAQQIQQQVPYKLRK